jgi:hypothetical protein
MADIPAIVNYQTKFCAENMQPVFNACYGALDRASTPEEGRTALDVYSKAETATLSYVNGTFLKTSGGTMSGPLDVIAGATGTQAPQAQEVVKKSGDTMTGPLEVPAGASGDQVMQASEIVALVADVTNTANLSDRGWIKDQKTGLIIQWGVAQATGPLTFPIPFPTACLRVICSSQHAFTSSVVAISVASAITNTGFTPLSKVQSFAGGAWTDNTGVIATYIAIGY